jgi:hypothetical protein
LGAQAAQLYIGGPSRIDPSGSLIVPTTGVLLVTQFPVSNRQKVHRMSIECPAEFGRLLERFDRGCPVLGLVFGDPE